MSASTFALRMESRRCQILSSISWENVIEFKVPAPSLPYSISCLLLSHFSLPSPTSSSLSFSTSCCLVCSPFALLTICPVYGTNYINIMAYTHIYLLSFMAPQSPYRLHLQLSLNQTRPKQTLMTKRKVMTRGNLCICMCHASSSFYSHSHSRCHKSLYDFVLRAQLCTVNQKRRNLYILMLP